VLNNPTPSRYRNRFLAKVMVQQRMIDTMCFGIREIMFRGQANRYLPMPDYDSTGPEHVIMRRQGRLPLKNRHARTNVLSGREEEDKVCVAVAEKVVGQG
jgi:ATP-dependent DNA helicase RecG